jgi:hypothetical protein
LKKEGLWMKILSLDHQLAMMHVSSTSLANIHIRWRRRYMDKSQGNSGTA